MVNAVKSANVINNMVEEERNVVAEGLELGLTLHEMKFACPFLGVCLYESRSPVKEKLDLRKNYCHNARDYLNCVWGNNGKKGK